VAANPDALQRYDEAQGALRGALSRLGVDTNFWAVNEPREDELVHTTELYERLKQLPQFNENQLVSALRTWDPQDDLTEHILVGSGMAHEIFRGEETTPGIEAVRELIKREGGVWIRKLLAIADARLQTHLEEEALRLCRMAVADCPRPRLHMELGYELARRAGLDPLPLIDDDFDWTSPGFWLVMVNGVNRTHTVGPISQEIAKPAPVDVAVSDEVRALFIRLALEAYGRSYGGCLNELSPSLGVAGDNDKIIDFTIAFWRLCALDGLREILTELRYFSEAECAAEAELAWHDIFEEASGFMPDKDFARGLSEFTGYVRGRQVESTVQEAVEEARRKVVVSDPDAFATQVAETVASKLGPVPVATRARIEDELKTQLGQAWTRPPDGVREQIVEAEWLKGLLEIHEGRDYTAVVVFYGKALESLLRYLSGSDDNLSEFRRQLLDERIRVRWLSTKTPKQVIDHLVSAIDLRNPAAHGETGPYRPVHRSRMVRMRDLIIDSESEDGLLALLNKHARWP
jgi:hypothetical protein